VELLGKIRPSPILKELFKDSVPSRTAVGYKDHNCQRRTKLGKRALLLHTAIGNGATNKFGIRFQWRNEHFMACPLFFILCRQLRFERSKILATTQSKLPDVSICAMMPMTMLRPVQKHKVFPISTARRISCRVG
jgi:hypothetical protein